MEEDRRGRRNQGKGKRGREGEMERGRKRERERGNEGEMHICMYRNASLTHQRSTNNLKTHDNFLETYGILCSCTAALGMFSRLGFLLLFFSISLLLTGISLTKLAGTIPSKPSSLRALYQLGSYIIGMRI